MTSLKRGEENKGYDGRSTWSSTYAMHSDSTHTLSPLTPRRVDWTGRAAAVRA
jgi:hypothetical protein